MRKQILTLLLMCLCTAAALATGAAPESGKYYRLWSKTSNKYVWMVGDTYTAANRSSDGFWGAIFSNSIVLHPKLSTVYSSTPSEEYASSAGTVVYITGNPNASGGLNKVDIVAQGIGSQSIIKKAGSNVEIIAESTPEGITKFYGNIFLGKRYLKDGASYGFGNSTILCGGDDNNEFELEPLDEAHMDKYYFGAAPKTKVGDKYYTTMYTAFPYKCYDGVKAYIVTKVDHRKSQISIREIKNGEVPANTPVILECLTDKPATNRLVPTTSQAIIVERNLLEGVIDINHNAGNDAYRTKFDPATMRVLAADGFKFGKTNTTGDNADYIATNTCYLPLTTKKQATIDNYDIDVERQPTTPFTPITLEALADLFTKQEIKQYARVAIVDDDLTCVFATKKYLYVKDDNKALVKDLPGAGDIDYMAKAGFGEAAHYDQSNWARISLKKPMESDDAARLQYVGKKLKGVMGSVTMYDAGTEIVATKNPVAGAENKNYVIKDKINDLTDNINTYCLASFAGTQVSPVNHKTFFFVTPKKYEVADITWAVWNKDKKAFVLPAKQGQANGYNLAGAVGVSSLAYNQGIRNYDDLQDGATYEFRTIISTGKGKGYSESNIPTDYAFTPLTLSSTGIITAVTHVEAGKAVASVRYINMQGMSSDKPFAGMNVVVTTYSDGSRTTTKEMH